MDAEETVKGGKLSKFLFPNGLVVLSLVLNLVLGFLLLRVNADLDRLYQINDKQGIAIMQLRRTQATMMTTREAQRLLEQQAQAYQSQINDLNTNVNVMVNQTQLQQQQATQWNIDRQSREENPFK